MINKVLKLKLPFCFSVGSSWDNLGIWPFSISSWCDCLYNGVAFKFLFKGSSSLPFGLSSTLPKEAPFASLSFLLSGVNPRLPSLQKKVLKNKN